MVTIKLAGLIALFVVVIQAIIIFIAKTWIASFLQHRFDLALASQRHQFDKALEDYKLGVKVREQAAAVAEYSVLAGALDASDPPQSYAKANKMARELFLWLPTDIYRKLGRGLAGDNKQLVEALVGVRAVILGGNAGNLGANDVIVHAPHIGKNPNREKY